MGPSVVLFRRTEDVAFGPLGQATVEVPNLHPDPDYTIRDCECKALATDSPALTLHRFQWWVALGYTLYCVGRRQAT